MKVQADNNNQQKLNKAAPSKSVLLVAVEKLRCTGSLLCQR